ncbi:GNAT family N-acetyltransferase [Litoribacterium kuwaitense]|uniref:GNAT family N-acetyltransferase n=1 Tax=Litoribacterium kuwaitense TaxID=1398745 RepID=UPI001FE3572E|nr:GNAT family N-acetyltransferase [Litoribacterium kuwaitense]
MFNGGERRLEADIVACMRASSERITIAEKDGHIVGFACAQTFRSFCYEERQAEITEMYVEPSAHQQGIATRLLAFLEDDLKSQGVSEIKLLTGRDNAAAISTYEKAGYEQDDELLFKKE